ncbi:hypothetical protein BGX38DRAFT_1329587, partial [Terfezia claveryi]
LTLYINQNAIQGSCFRCPRRHRCCLRKRHQHHHPNQPHNHRCSSTHGQRCRCQHRLRRYPRWCYRCWSCFGLVNLVQSRQKTLGCFRCQLYNAPLGLGDGVLCLN